ncbi:MAG TPA: translation initiation factor IF-2 N-terminal domain-containing protein, partial [bacterium]|nr:translation initiation factor IF-2 N-terminal domain-containing protein [bacterium]
MSKKVFQLAKELLVSHQEIVTFLQKSGFKEVKNHMSGLDEEMIEKVMAKFSKEKKHADTYQRIKDKKEKKDEKQTSIFELSSEPKPEPELEPESVKDEKTVKE